MIHDPALLIWLDAPANHEEHPNENLARELLELFTLGIGHYTEIDVREAARALTGWTTSQGRFSHIAAGHDDGEKLLLGRRGRWCGDDVLSLLVDHPATATRLSEPARPLPALALAERHGQGGDMKTVLRFFSRLLLGREPPPSWEGRIAAMVRSARPTAAETARRIVALVLSSPEAQLA